jgi:hypothetical protein
LPFADSQVLRDLKLAIDHTADDEAVAEQAAAWRAAAIAFLRKAPPPKTGKRIKKLFRLASYHWLCAVDNALKVTCGFGLSHFKVAKENMQKSVTGTFVYNQLSICIDQGSVGWCPSFYMLFAAGLSIALHFDVLHRAWNDLKAALVLSGLWDVVLDVPGVPDERRTL